MDEADVITLLQKNNFFGAIATLNKLAAKDEDKADEIIRKYRYIFDRSGNESISITNTILLKDGDIEQLKKSSKRYKNLNFEFKETGSRTEILINAEKYHRDFAGMRKAIVAVAVISLLAIAGIFAYTTFIQEHPLEEINFEVENSVMQAGNSFRVDVSFTPKNASDKQLEITCNYPDVEIIDHGSSLEIIAGPSIDTGDIITLHVKNDKYNISRNLNLEVENNISLELKTSKMLFSSGDEFFINCISSATDLDVCPIWNVDVNWITFEPNGSGIDAVIKPGVAEGSKFKITATLPNSKVFVEETYTISDAFDFNLIFDSTQVDSGIPFKVKAVSSKDLSELKWSVDKEWVDLTVSGDEVNVAPSLLAKKGEKFTIMASIENTPFIFTKEFTIDNELELKLASSTSIISSGKSVTISAEVSPIRTEEKIQWDVNGRNVTYSINGDKIVCNVSSSAIDKDKIVVTATLDKYGLKKTVEIKVSNPSNVMVKVTTEDQFRSISNNPGGNYSIENDIVLTKPWVPFTFNGVLYGNGNTISGLDIDVDTSKDSSISPYAIGLFSINEGTIDGVVIDHADIVISVPKYKTSLADSIACGILAGRNGGSISDCSVSESSIFIQSNADQVTQNIHMGGFVGVNRINKTIDKSEVTGVKIVVDITGKDRGQKYVMNVGGFCGYMRGQITSCQTEDITISGAISSSWTGADILIGLYEPVHTYNMGGFVGRMSSSDDSNVILKDCISKVSVNSISMESDVGSYGNIYGTKPTQKNVEKNDGSLIGCRDSGSITVSGCKYVGSNSVGIGLTSGITLFN